MVLQAPVFRTSCVVRERCGRMVVLKGMVMDAPKKEGDLARRRKGVSVGVLKGTWE